MKKLLTAGLLAAGLLAATSLVSPIAQAADALKIGVVTTLSGPQAALGQDLVDGAKLALKHLNNNVGGRPANLVIGDDQLKPDLAQQLIVRMLERDQVDVFAGFTFSNILLAAAPQIFAEKIPIISLNAGPSQLAGSQCSKLFFSTAWQNDNSDEAAGMYMNKAGIGKVFALAHNYPAGKDKIGGFKRTFKGQLVGELYTPLNQLDFSAEIAQIRAAKPDAIFIFYPGGLGVNFIKQVRQAGLDAPLFGDQSSFDQTILPGVGAAGVGARTAVFWSEKMDTPRNKKFVQDFEADYGRIPSIYAAQAYDGIAVLDGALKLTKGSLADKEAFHAAMHKIPFESLRGNFDFAPNGYPKQDWHLAEVVLDEKGRPTVQPRETIISGMSTAFDDQCPLK